MKRYIRVITLLILLTIILICCGSKKDEQAFRLPATPVLSIRSSWGVVNSNYLRLRVKPSTSSKVLDGLTKGTIVKILSTTEKKETVEDETDYWYRVSLEGLEGWVFGAYMSIIDSKSKAEKMAEELR
jgi:uncharacterized protein YgiM (DUF1202 family)